MRLTDLEKTLLSILASCIGTVLFFYLFFSACDVLNKFENERQQDRALIRQYTQGLNQ